MSLFINRFRGLPRELLWQFKVLHEVRVHIVDSFRYIGYSAMQDKRSQPESLCVVCPHCRASHQSLTDDCKEERRAVDNDIGSLAQYLRWLLPHPSFGLEGLSNGPDRVEQFTKHVLCHKRIRLYFSDFLMPRETSAYSKAFAIDAMKRFVKLFENLFNVKLHPMVPSNLNSFKQGARREVEKVKQSSLTIESMTRKKQFVSSEDMEEIRTLLWKRIVQWIVRARESSDKSLLMTPDVNIGSSPWSPTQLAVMAMDFMVYYFFTIGDFGSRSQFLQVQNIGHMGQWAASEKCKLLNVTDLLKRHSKHLCSSWGTRDADEKVGLILYI